MNYDKRAKKQENLEIGEISYRDEDSLEESPKDENNKKKKTDKQTTTSSCQIKQTTLL